MIQFVHSLFNTKLDEKNPIKEYRCLYIESSKKWKFPSLKRRLEVMHWNRPPRKHWKNCGSSQFRSWETGPRKTAISEFKGILQLWPSKSNIKSSLKIFLVVIIASRVRLLTSRRADQKGIKFIPLFLSACKFYCIYTDAFAWLDYCRHCRTRDLSRRLPKGIIIALAF